MAPKGTSRFIYRTCRFLKHPVDKQIIYIIPHDWINPSVLKIFSISDASTAPLIKTNLLLQNLYLLLVNWCERRTMNHIHILLLKVVPRKTIVFHVWVLCRGRCYSCRNYLLHGRTNQTFRFTAKALISQANSIKPILFMARLNNSYRTRSKRQL